MSVEAGIRARRRGAERVDHRAVEAHGECAAREHAPGRKEPAGRGARARVVARGKEGARCAIGQRVAEEGDGGGDVGKDGRGDKDEVGGEGGGEGGGGSEGGSGNVKTLGPWAVSSEREGTVVHYQAWHMHSSTSSLT